MHLHPFCNSLIRLTVRASNPFNHLFHHFVCNSVFLHLIEMAATVESSGGFRAHERDDTTASIDQLKGGELLKPGNEPHRTVHNDVDEPLPEPGTDSVADEQSTASYYAAPVPAASHSVESYEEDARVRAPPSGDMLTSGNEVRQEPSSGGYNAGVNEEVPPRHKIHTDDELLPKPRSESFTEEQGNESYQDAPEFESAESYQDSRATELEGFNETESAQHGATNETDGASYDRSAFDLGRDQKISGVTEPNTFENGAAEAPNAHGTPAISEFSGSPKYDRDVTEPARDGTNGSDALISQFPDAPTGTKVAERGDGVDHSDTAEPGLESAPEHGAEHPSKKEGFMAKMMEKLPGHHHKPAEIAAPEHDSSTPTEHHETATSSPRKGLMAKIKEKLPGHHATAAQETPV